MQLVFALYSLKELLRVEKGRRYKLGLKGFSGVLQQRWRDELIEEHRQLAAQFYQDWHERYEELEVSEDDLAYRFRYLLAHTELSEDAELKQLVWSDEIFVLCGFMSVCLKKQGMILCKTPWLMPT